MNARFMMRLTSGAAAALFVCTVGAWADPPPEKRVSVLVELDPGADRDPVRNFAATRGGHVRYEYQVALPDVINIRDIPEGAVTALAKMPGVVKVVEDQYHPNLLSLHDSTPLIRGLQSQITGAGLSADGSGVRVCVCDTGIDSNHIMYSSRIDTAAGRDFHNNDNNPEDDNGHGAHVAGITVGGTGLTVDFGCVGPEPFQGVAPAATLIGVKVLSATGGGSDSNIIAGIDYCADQSPSGGRADVINLSLGDPAQLFSGVCDSHTWAIAANNAVDAGVVVVVASGNECARTAMRSPACASKTIAVGATWDENFPNCEDSTRNFPWGCCLDRRPNVDQLVCFSNGGTQLDVTAPGCRIYSAEINDSSGVGTTISPKCGTSMAAPHVAGLAALVLDVNPLLTPAQVRQFIRDGAIDLGPSGFDTDFGYGRIDVINTLQLLQCGNSVCDAGETSCNCPADCGAPPATETNCTDGIDNDCGGGTDCDDTDCASHPACQVSCDNDTICESGEDCFTCPNDCPGKQNGPPSGRYCCGNGIAEPAEGNGSICDGNY